MTVTTTTTKFSFYPGSAMAPVAIPFQFLSSDHVTVVLIEAATGERSTLTEGSHYTLSGDGPSASASITATAVYETDDIFEVARVTPATQPVDLIAHQSLPSATVEQMLDRQILIAQEVKADVVDTRTRAILVPVGETGGVIDSERADTVLGFDADGVPEVKTYDDLAEVIAPLVPGNLVGEQGPIGPAGPRGRDSGVQALTLDSDGGYPMMEFDLPRQVYYFNNKFYATFASFLTAIGGEEADGHQTIGYVVKEPDLAVNGTPSGTSGWLTSAGTTITGSSGELELTTTGAETVSYAYQTYSGVDWQNKCFLVTMETKRGPSSLTVRPGSSFADTTLNKYIGTANASASWVETSFLCTANDLGSLSIGARVTGTPNGTWYIRNVVIQEAVPFTGHPGADMAAVLRTPINAGVTATEVLFEQRIGTINEDYQRISFNHTTREVIAHIESNNFAETNNQVMGTVPVDDDEIRIGWSQVPGVGNDDLYMSVNGGAVTSDINTSYSGVAEMLIGYGTSGTAYNGSVQRLAVFSASQPNDWLIHVTAGDSAFVTLGDSYMAGAGGYNLKTYLPAEAGRFGINLADGGDTPEMQADLYEAAAYLANRSFVFWDGGPSGIGTLAVFQEHFGRILELAAHTRFIVLPGINPPAQFDDLVTTFNPANATFVLTEAIRDWLLTAYPNNTIDILPVLQGLAISDVGDPGYAKDAEDVSLGTAPRSLFFDGTHMGLDWSGQNIMQDVVAPLIAARMPLIGF